MTCRGTLGAIWWATDRLAAPYSGPLAGVNVGSATGSRDERRRRMGR